MRGLAWGGFCGQVLQRHSFASLACHHIQLPSLILSPFGFPWSFRHLGCRLVGSSSDESEMSLCLASFNPDNSDGPQKFQEGFTSLPAQNQRPANRSHSGKVVDSFLDMGFSHTEIKELFNLQPRLLSQARLAVVSELLLLGLNTDSILKALQKNNELLRLSPKHIKERSDFLRKFNFKEGSLNHIAVHCPSIFTLPQRRIEAVKDLLKEKCLFTVQQISKILQTCPNVILEDLDDLEYKFQFAYFRLGVKHREIVSSGFFQASLAEIKNRSIFLERLGLYQTPDKKGQTQILNPKLKTLIRASETDFVTKVACSTIEEYQVFQKLLAREEQQKWNEDGTLKVEFSDIETDEESDTE